MYKTPPLELCPFNSPRIKNKSFVQFKGDLRMSVRKNKFMYASMMLEVERRVKKIAVVIPYEYYKVATETMRGCVERVYFSNLDKEK